MDKLSRILVPTDFSEGSQTALEYACGLAKPFDAEIHLLHVIANDTAIAMGSDGFFSVSDDILNDIRAGVKKKLEETADKISTSVRNIVTVVREGPPFSEIVQYAKANDIDMIVLGTHGRTGISHLLIGSVAEKVVRKARIPVVTVPLEGHEFAMP